TPKITVTSPSAELLAGETLTLTATITPADASATLTFTSSDTSIATVSDTGVVTGVSAGTATITVSASGAESVICVITIATPNYSVEFAEKVVSITNTDGYYPYWYPEVTVTPTSATEDLRYTIYSTEENNSVAKSISIGFAERDDITSTNAKKNKVIMHELGHALGLAHPHDSNYVNTDLNGEKYWTVLAVMNQGLFEEKQLISALPSGFDLWNLDKRWGN
ncbi:MAG: Ig-like domain-containing protein, partial [Clostridia bacterium]|nr:Ig-like domain-containing protein [Clostridia bacterium]